MSAVGHVMILASAGSGKTYALTNRFVKLLALGAAPERIVALTFTRKAAGEFFDEILNKLARAASEPDFAQRLAKQIDAPAFGTRDFLRLLRAVVDTMHRLRLGTFDGFFARIARNFPFELGLTGEFEVLQEHSARMERGRVLRRMFERTGELADSQKEFIEAFKRATFGVDEKRLGAQLDAFLDRHQEIFLSVSEAALWGNPRQIWPDGAPWFGAADRRAMAAQVLRAELAKADLSDKQRERWSRFFAELAEWSPGAMMGDALEYLFKNALKSWPALTEIMVERKKHPLTERASEALRTLIYALFELELVRRMEVTRGIHAVVSGYESVYHDAVRRAGKLSFADVQRLLLPGGESPVLSSGGDVDTTEARMLIDFRLDGEIDHWLLDEFQDTSYGQWLVLKNLIDEVIQDPEGRRSFFYVGDVKQAIYAWREGDPRLFREIFDGYNALLPGAIAEQHLIESYRSGPPVIEMVNTVFGAAPVFDELFPGAASQAWNAEWQAHVSAKPELGGHAALLHAEDEAARFATALALLQEIEPLERGLSCAVLMQDNKTAAKLADYLRREGGLPAQAEADLHVCTDNPLGSALLALFKAAAHPGDTLAWEHVRMTPLGTALAAAGLATPESVTRQLLTQLHADGFECTARTWIARVEPALAANDAFTRERGRQFTAAAALFDATGSRDVAEFIAFMERHTVRDTEGAGVIRVMTIHKSKGLGFDLVLLPDLEGVRLDSRRDGLAVARAADRTAKWVLDLPGKLFHEHDEVLSAYVRGAEADACYESFSLLYVAMTRAKRALYVITKAPGKSVSRNFPKLLAETLGEEPIDVRVGRRQFDGAFAVGDADWFQALRPPAAAEQGGRARESGGGASGGGVCLPALARGTIQPAPRFPARLPSGAKRAELTGPQLFSLALREGSEFGIAVHRLLAEVEQGGAAAAAQYRARWAQTAEPDVVEAALACLTEPALAGVWQLQGNIELWRERPFEVVLDGEWMTGVFDRVVVSRADDGRVLAAKVFDFKTDRVTSEIAIAQAAKRHAPQLKVYRRVVAVLTGLPTEAVAGELVFTHSRVSVRQ